MVEMRDDVDGVTIEIHAVRRKRRVTLIYLRVVLVLVQNWQAYPPKRLKRNEERIMSIRLKRI